MTLSAYNYTIKYKSGKQQGNVDALSRFPLPDSPTSTPTPAETVVVIEHMWTIPLTTSKIAQQTKRDFNLLKVKHYTKLGWPTALNMQEMHLNPYFNQRNEPSLENNALLWGNCVVMPSCFQARVMDILHSTRISISRMKNLARQYLWWPKIDTDIEAKVKGCSTCAVSGSDPPPTVLHPWKWPNKPWYIWTMFLGKMHSKSSSKDRLRQSVFYSV